MSRRRTALNSIAALYAVLSLGACGGDVKLDQAAAALVEHYATHPPATGWTITGVTPEHKSGKLVADVLVTSDTDIQRIKILSRMEQFTIAKLACPTMTPALRAAIGTKARVWVQLRTEKETLTTSICPE